MNNYTEEAKQIYNKVCDKYKHHWLDTTVSQTMAMEMITEALSIVDVSNRRELLLAYSKWWDNKYSPQRKDFHRHKDIDSFLSQ